MRFATLLFYAVASIFLGIVAIATGGAVVLQSIFTGELGVGGSHEPWQTILSTLVVAIPLFFIALAVLSIFVQPADAPATPRDIRFLITELGASGKDNT